MWTFVICVIIILIIADFYKGIIAGGFCLLAMLSDNFFIGIGVGIVVYLFLVLYERYAQ